MLKIAITAALLALPLCGCASTQEACCARSELAQACDVKAILTNPYASPEARQMADRAILMHMDSGATTPSQHALIKSFAQQAPQTNVIVGSPRMVVRFADRLRRQGRLRPPFPFSGSLRS